MKDLDYRTHQHFSHHPYHMAPQNSSKHSESSSPYTYSQNQRNSTLISSSNGFQLTRESSHNNRFSDQHRQRQHHQQQQSLHTTQSFYQPQNLQQRQDQQIQQQQQQFQQMVSVTNNPNIYAHNFIGTALATSSTSSSSQYLSDETSFPYNFYSQQTINESNINSDNFFKFNNNKTLIPNQFFPSNKNNNNRECNHNINCSNIQISSANDNIAQQQPHQQSIPLTLYNQSNNQNQNEKENSAASSDKFPMDANEIASFIANELLMQQLVSPDGIHSGVPTQTTPTLTPTLLSTIESFNTNIETGNARCQAGFIPPPLFHDKSDSDAASEVSRSSLFGTNLHEESSQATTDNSSAATDTTSFQNGMNGFGHSSTSSTTNDFTNINFGINPAAINDFGAGVSINNSPTSSNRKSGGRRPNQSSNLSPEEEEKRRIRRERNKLAAARCRKRRVDQTNDLLDEVAKLEKAQENLNKNIVTLRSEEQELTLVLLNHRSTCQKIRKDLLTVKTIDGIIAPNTNDGNIGLETNLTSLTGRSFSPIEYKPNIYNHAMLPQIKNEPEDINLDNSLDDTEGPPSPKRALPDVATLQASLHGNALNTLNTPILTTAPMGFGSLSSNLTLNTLNKTSIMTTKPRPNTLPLPTEPRNKVKNLSLNMVGGQTTEIQGVPIQTPSTGMFNFASLMEGGTGLTPNCSSQNKLPLELTTPTSEPSKLLSL